MIKFASIIMSLFAGGISFASTLLSSEKSPDEAITVVDISRPLSVAVPSSATTTSWIDCARENETCSISGSILARYGSGDKVVIKELTGAFLCGNKTFGDPAYGVAKSCSYIVLPAASGWIPCAGENQTCTTPGSTVVRYGANTKFSYRDTTSRISCNNETFGDPISGIVKSCSYRAIAPTLLPFGLYVGNPNGNSTSEMTQFQSRWDASVRQLNRTPQFFGAFTDTNQDWSSWPSNAAWFAWSFNRSGRGTGLKPVIGIKLSTNAYWGRQNDAFQEIISGKHDQVYRDVVAAWRDAGYAELRFRISYEFNGSFMPDNFGGDARTLDLWRRAFAHVADVMHAVPNVKVLIVWNPANINQSNNSVADAYPGDRYVDIIASDIYSSLYPLGFHDWSGGPTAPTLTEWAKNSANRIHFWDHPGATQWTVDGSGWGMTQALNFATSHNKPFALSETGIGGDNVKTGLADDPEFPAYLRTRLNDFTMQGGIVDHVIIWDYDASDGAWRFTNVPAKTATASAWTAFVN